MTSDPFAWAKHNAWLCSHLHFTMHTVQENYDLNPTRLEVAWTGKARRACTRAVNWAETDAPVYFAGARLVFAERDLRVVGVEPRVCISAVAVHHGQTFTSAVFTKVPLDPAEDVVSSVFI